MVDKLKERTSLLKKATAILKAIDDFNRPDMIQGVAEAKQWLEEKRRIAIRPRDTEYAWWELRELETSINDLEQLLLFSKAYNDRTQKVTFLNIYVTIAEAAGKLEGENSK